MKDKLRKQLKSSAKRRARRASSAPTSSPPVRDAVESEFDSVFHRLVARVLELAEANPVVESEALVDRAKMSSRAVHSACRAFLRFGTPQDPTAEFILQSLVRLESEVDCSTKVFRDAVDTLMRRASEHVSENTLIDYLQTIRH